MTLRDWLERGEAQLLSGPHPDRARRDAETLLLHLIGKNRAWLLAHLADDFAGCTAIRYASLLERRHKGEPIQYITGEAEFYGLPFRVSSDVLVPRPETEHLVEKVIELAPLFRKPRIVDVGTGSGAIAIALAHECPNAAVTAIDISEPALTVARDNAVRVGFADRIRFLHGDLLSPVIGEQFEFVVSNPPYVSIADRASLPSKSAITNPKWLSSPVKTVSTSIAASFPRPSWHSFPAVTSRSKSATANSPASTAC